MPEATRILDLTLSDDQLLAQMKPKGRYNIGLAQKHGVRTELSDDVTAYAALAEQTARRDGFKGHSDAFYRHFLKDLPGSFLLLAYLPDENRQKTAPEGPLESPHSHGTQKPIAGLLGVIWGPPAPSGLRRAGSAGLYYYGASSNEHRERMAPYLLQWEAMRHCRNNGCTSYDLFGIAPEGQVDHPWAGVSEFKAKFGGKVVTYSPERELILRPAMKKLLAWKRKFV